MIPYPPRVIDGLIRTLRFLEGTELGDDLLPLEDVDVIYFGFRYISVCVGLFVSRWLRHGFSLLERERFLLLRAILYLARYRIVNVMVVLSRVLPRYLFERFLNVLTALIRLDLNRAEVLNCDVLSDVDCL